ncbi:interleukin-13 receptor subunit alpha-1-like isoform X3 [Mixophyes fleayi]|uniref:interleukin-13 receptor subunit alpha-1-like isoform X3 n=1 Tax=Mixophyes fleayi TaxID=3061075 RepID=UPI003F4D9062
MGTLYCCNVILGFLLSVDFIIRSAGTEYLAPPTDFTFRMDGMFSLLWEWKPPMVNCTLTYIKNATLGNGLMKRDYGPRANLNLDIAEFDLNHGLSLQVEAVCDNGMKSKPVTYVEELMSGNENTSVRNFSCVWYYEEYVNCTWKAGQDTPPNVHFIFQYWVESESETVPTKFSDLLDTGEPCQKYFPSDGVNLGCQFKFQQSSLNIKNLLMVVSDRSKTIKPFIFHTDSRDIGDDSGTTTSTVLLIVIPIIVVVAAIILLICLKRLKIIICPSIPDPGKMFPSDLQEWLKSERPNSHHKPEKEEVCPVSLLEYSLPSSQIS